MPISLAHLEMRLSGGASNSDPAASLGGVISSTRILSQSATGLANITGVVINDAAGNATGAGTLQYLNAGKTLTWTPNGGTPGTPVTVSADGKYTIKGSVGYLLVTVTAANLPGTDQSDTITIAYLPNKLWDDVSKTESFDGDTEYRCFYIRNTDAMDTFIGTSVYISSQTLGADSLEIGLDPAGIGNGSTTGVATTIASESTAPAGVTFSAPSGTGTALSIGNLGPGQSAAIWQKRVVPANTALATLNNLSAITVQVRL